MIRLCLVLFISLSSISAAWAQDDSTHGETLSAVCAACHGKQGNSAISLFPKLAGQQHDYLLKQLTDIQSGQRSIPEMATLLDHHSQQDLSDISAYFALQKVTIGKAAIDKVEQGEALFRFGNPDSAVPACASCHGPAGQGLNSAKFPALSGQFEAYTKKQLHHFKSGKRANDTGQMMQTIAKKLTDQEIDAVASYIQGLH